MNMRNPKRCNMLHFAVSDEEASIINLKMKSLGIRNLSAYLRAMALNGRIIRLDLSEVRELIRLLGNMTNNLNQIAKRINAHGQLYETEIDEIQANQNELQLLMDQLLIKLNKIQ